MYISNEPLATLATMMAGDNFEMAGPLKMAQGRHQVALNNKAGQRNNTPRAKQRPTTG